MDAKEKKKNKKLKKQDKQPITINFSDFSFLGSTPIIVDPNLFKITPQDLSGSASFKLVSDEFVNPSCTANSTTNTDEIDQQLLRDDDCEAPCYKLKEWDKIQPMYKEVSSLSEQQHSQCLNALEILSSGCEPSSEQENNNIDTFRKLEAKRIAEYEKFSLYVENIWKTKNNARLLEIQSSLKCYINEYWRYRLSRVSTYPQKYRIASMLPLDINSGNCKKSNVTISPQDVVYECGTQITFSLPSTNKRILSGYDELKFMAPIEEKIESASTASVSQDKIATDLALKYEADVVISSSGLKCLLDNHPPSYNREWILPIVIKEYKSESDYKIQKIIFVDKPLPLAKYSVQQLNQWVHKISLKTSVIFGNDELNRSSGESPSYIPYSPRSPETSKSEDDDDSESVDPVLSSPNNDDTDSDNLMIDEYSENKDDYEDEILEVGRVTRSMSKTRCQTPSTPTKLSRERHSDMQDESCRSEHTPEKKPNVNSPASDKPKYKLEDNKHEMISHVQEKPLLKNVTSVLNNDDNQKSEELLNCKPPKSQPRTTYRIWKMVEHTDEQGTIFNFLKKDGNKELKVLIRSKSHGTLNQSDGSLQEIILTPKLEYQLEFGAECSSLSECTRQWCSLSFQPDAKLLRARINPQNSEVCSYEVLDLQAITSETFRVHKHNPKRDLNRLFRILNILASSVLPGSYILKHDAAMVEGAKLYMADNSVVQLDLQNVYRNVSLDKIALQRFPWNPIDPFVITSKHKKSGVLPSTFSFHFRNRIENLKESKDTKHVGPKQKTEKHKKAKKNKKKK